jgi:hypothetical protein
MVARGSARGDRLRRRRGRARRIRIHKGSRSFSELLLSRPRSPSSAGRVGRRVAAFVAAGLEWAWVSRHLRLRNRTDIPDRVDVAAMPETLRFPFLALWSGIGFAGMLGLALRERRGTEST